MLLLPVVFAAALNGFYFEQKTQSGADGSGAMATRVWCAGPKMRMESGDAFAGSALILRLDENRGYRLDLAERTVEDLDLERLGASSRMGLAIAGDVMGGGEGANPRTAGIEGKTVAGFVCTGHRIRVGDTVMDVFVSPKVPVSLDDFRTFLEWTGAGESMGSLLGEIKKLPGFPLETRTRIRTDEGIQETVSTITLIKKAAHEPSLFEPPKGYKRVAPDDEEEP